ncbi:MAG TPA: ABC transporter permease [Paludibacteraceae bacterium]|nr:ABC transporter permease [Paludibacteraceae bacterium]HQJ89340.1 ABC transporter permease [Paludibacteraceae bacterium]
MITTTEQQEWTTVIKPTRGLFSMNFKDMWRYRDLYSIYVVRNITTVYKQTILGPLWFFVEPVFSTIMFMVVFGGIAGIPTDTIPQPIFYMSGILLWNYFLNCFNASSGVFVANAGVFGKVYFPRLIVPLATITSNLFKMGIQLVLFICLYLYFVFVEDSNICPNWTLVLFPLYIVFLAMTALSWGLIVSALATKYRDLRMFIGFMMGLFMYATPIIYPMSMVKDSIYGPFLSYNPIAPFFEAFRYGVTSIGSIDWMWMLYSLFCLVVTMTIGLVVFNRVEKNFIDTV